MKQLKKSVRIKGLCPEGNKILDLVVWDKATFEQIPKRYWNKKKILKLCRKEHSKVKKNPRR
jgi:hypothetical protein